jgi:hypothetical protein
MSVLLICCFIFAICIIVYLFISYNLSNNTLIVTKNLNEINAPIKITNQPNSTRSAIAVWIYITSWNKLTEKEIFKLPGKYRLYLEAKLPILHAEIFTTGGKKNITITLNFPIQKWTYITLSMDNAFIDCYIDGKLIKSIQLEDPQDKNTTPSLYIGGDPAVLHDIVLNNIKRWIEPQTPQSIYNEYISGNGNYFFSNSFAAYGLQLQLLKNNVASGTLTFF